MPDPLRLLTAPLRLTGRLRLGHLVTLVSTDTLVRLARAAERPVTWECATMAGDLAGQYEVDRELAREGQDRGQLTRALVVERVRACEASARARVGGLATSLGVEVDLDAGALDRPQAALAARTAFVRLFEEGLLALSEQVVDTCPRCLTVVDGADAELVEVDGRRLTVRLDGSVQVTTQAPELLAAAVAVAVPVGDPAEGSRVELPLAGRVVPVIATDTPSSWLVAPAHDPAGWELARRHGLAPLQLFDLEGVAHHDGPLDGLGRFAARAAATDLLATEGVLLASVPATETAPRCRRCRTVLIPRLGRHWTLPMAALEMAAADAVRQGHIAFSPGAARDAFLARAGQGEGWCVSYQVVAGQPVPAATCLDCGRLTVSVEPLDDCPRCMGELSPDQGALDARFVGAVWPLAAAGWPSVPANRLDPRGTTLVVGPDGVTGWALRMAALGLRLAGAVPFSDLVVHRLSAPEDDPDPMVEDVEELVDRVGTRVVRAALLAGGLDTDRATEVVAALDADAGGVAGGASLSAVEAAVEAAFVAGRPGDALPVLVAASGQPGLARLTAPLLGNGRS